MGGWQHDDKEEEDDEEEEEATSDIKPNNPHVTGGEKSWRGFGGFGGEGCIGCPRTRGPKDQEGSKKKCPSKKNTKKQPLYKVLHGVLHENAFRNVKQKKIVPAWETSDVRTSEEEWRNNQVTSGAEKEQPGTVKKRKQQ